MTAYTIYNSSLAPRDLYLDCGHCVVPANDSAVFELTETDVERVSRMSSITFEKGGKATESPKVDERPPVQEDVANADTPDIEKLRADYTELTGKKPDGRWSAERLQSEIDKALA